MTLILVAVLAFGGVLLIIRPEIAIRTAQHAHPTLREDDPSVRFIAQVIGGGWLFMDFFILLEFLAHQPK
jgi:hypothetical protein